MEEVAPVAVSDAMLLAPEEIQEKKADVKGDTEKTATDRKHDRRLKKKKQRMRAKEKEQRKKLIEKTKPGLGNKHSKQAALAKLEKETKSGSGNVSVIKEGSKSRKDLATSSAFFTRLQDEVQAQIKTKTESRKNKKKGERMSAPRLKLWWGMLFRRATLQWVRVVFFRLGKTSHNLVFSWGDSHPSGPQLSSSVQAGPKRLFRSDFSSCSEPAEIWHVYSFCVKKCPCVFFFKNAETSGQNCVKFNPPPPPLPLSVSKQHRISIFEGQKTVHVSFMLMEGDWGGGGGECEKGGGGMCLKPCFPACGKKNTGTFFNTKRVDMPNFSRFGATWKIATK